MDYSLLPKVDRILAALAERPGCLPEDYSPALLTEAARQAVARLRTGGEAYAGYDRAQLFALALTATPEIYRALRRPSLRQVLNATGVVLHTNLGRSPLAAAAAAAVQEAASGYCNLELDLATGKRGSRYDHVSALLCQLTGAEDALAVNNNAAAVLLCLSALARGGEAVVSRGQLVEIGGSFRIPDIMALSGARLHEVGTTNKTHVSDYQSAINDQTRLLLQVHPSNFLISGFTAEVATAELAALAHTHHLPLLYDLGSGCLYPFAEQGIGREPSPAQLIAQGVDILTFSGDKLLGGPQAGLIVGRKQLIQRVKSDPLTRALRVDKFTVAALEATLGIYRDGREREEIPAIAMIVTPLTEIAARARRLHALLQAADTDGSLYQLALADTVSPVGGGSLPEVNLPTLAVELKPRQGKTQDMLARLRAGEPALLAYIHEDKLRFDPRTLREEEIEQAARLIRAAAEVEP